MNKNKVLLTFLASTTATTTTCSESHIGVVPFNNNMQNLSDITVPPFGTQNQVTSPIEIPESTKITCSPLKDEAGWLCDGFTASPFDQKIFDDCMCVESLFGAACVQDCGEMAKNEIENKGEITPSIVSLTSEYCCRVWKQTNFAGDSREFCAEHRTIELQDSVAEIVSQVAYQLTEDEEWDE